MKPFVLREVLSLAISYDVLSWLWLAGTVLEGLGREVGRHSVEWFLVGTCLTLLFQHPTTGKIISGEMWKRSFISRLGVPSTLIRHKKRNFLKTLFKPEEFKNTGSSMDLKPFWKRSFSKMMTSQKSCDFPARGLLKHKSKMTGDGCVFKFLKRSVNGT